MASGTQVRKRFDHHQDSKMFQRSVAMGLVPGWTAIRIFAMNDDVNGAGTTEDIWPPGTIKVWPTAATVASVVSTAAADTAAGTGAQTVVVVGLDAGYKQISEVVELNGITPVNTTQSFLRINSIYCQRVGSGAVNAGDIDVSIGGNVQKHIEAGEGNCHCLFWTVPAGHSLLIEQYSIGVGRMGGSSDAEIDGQIRLYDPESHNNYASWRSISDIFLYNGSSHKNDQSVTVLPEKSDLRGQITSTSATQCYGIFGGLLVENKYL